ncbi:MAG TPA: hypothetical protein VJR27_03920 [Candidatus Saccharimonadales bacterium]|nr:hypothetical protein [Candidatus Saccharimonadales bacterium]
MRTASGEKQDTDRLLLSIAEQLKLPLLHIARQAELDAAAGQPSVENLLRMQLSAEAALRLVDSYLLGLQLSQQQAQLELEPVSLSSTLVDIAHQLDGFAQLYDIDLELHVAGKYTPVMAHAAGIRAAFLSLGYTFIEALPNLQADRRRLALRLAAHRTPHGLVAGLYSDATALTSQDLRTAQRLYGTARQPFTQLSATGGAGIFVADAIFRAMASKLRVGRHQKLTGFAATLQPSRQLQLV